MSFAGQAFSVGIDVHRKRWAVVIRSGGLKLQGFSMNPSPEELIRYLERTYPDGTCRLVYESGFCGFWIQRAFARHGLECLVVNPADVPTAHKERTDKRDPVDAHKLARELEHGTLTGIYVPDEAHQHLRSLARLQVRVVQQSTRLKNRIKGLLYYNGIELPRHTSQWPAAFIAHLRSLPLDGGPGHETLHFLLDELEQHRTRRVAVLRRLRAWTRQGDAATVLPLLLSVPGIGFKTAIILYTELIDMGRFPSFDQLKAFVGLVPSIHASGDTEHTRGLTRRRHRLLKYALIEAAWVAVRKDPVLVLAFQQLTARMKKQQAIIRIATKLLSRIRHVWLHGCAYEPGVIE